MGMGEQELKDILDKHGRWLNTNGYSQWKFVQKSDNRYLITSCGDVFSLVSPSGIRSIPLKLKGRKAANGYLTVSIRIGGAVQTKLIHRLVAEAFIGKCDHMVVHHKNGKRTDNPAENLKIVDYSENNLGSAKTRAANKRKVLNSLSAFEAAP